MTIIIKLTEEDLCNIIRISGEIDPSLSTSILDISSNHYIIDTGAINIDSVNKKCTIDIDSKFLSYLTGPILDVISMFKMMGRSIIRMFDDKFGGLFNDKIVIIKNGKQIEDEDINKDEVVYNV